MYKYKFFILLSVQVFACFFFNSKPLFSQSTLQEDNFFLYPSVPYETVSTSEDLTSLFFNPAGLSFHPLQAGYYYNHNVQNNIQDHTVLVNLFGLAFSGQWRFVHNKDRLRTFTIGTAFGFQNLISLGISYSWTQSNILSINNYQSFNLGLILRPWRYLSLGITGKTLNAPANITNIKLKTRWEAGFSIRPYIERLSISFDALVFNLRNWVPRYTIKYEPVDGFDLYASFDHSFNLQFGLNFKSNIFKASTFSMVSHLNNRRNSRIQGDSAGAGILIGRERYKSKIEFISYFLEIPLNMKFQENKKRGFLFFQENISFTEIIQAIKKAEQDKQIKGILITGRYFKGGWGQAEELRNALLQFHQHTNKPIYAYLESASHKEYYIVSVASQISMPPASTLELTGFKSDIYFFKDLLKKVGIEPNFIQKGRYKTAPDIFQRSTPSEFEKEQLLSVLKDIASNFKKSVLIHRKNKIKSYNAIFQKGLFNAVDAKQMGLIDKIEYLSDFHKSIKYKKVKHLQKSITQYIKTKTYNSLWGAKDKIAVLVLEGDILSGESQIHNLLNRSYISSDNIQKVVKTIKKDFRIKGVLVRINSSGGSSLASDIIWKEIKELSKVKKVIVSFSNTAASGGYYIATAADTILSNENSITGSIGVFGGKFSFKDLYQKIGINKYSFKTHTNATLFTEAENFTTTEKALLDEHLSGFYDLFLERVQRNRTLLNKKEVRKNAEGKVYTGFTASNNKMVDKIGGISIGLQLLIEQLKLDANYLDIEIYPKKSQSILEQFLSSNLVIPSSIQKLVHLASKSKALSESKVFFLMPYDLEIK